MVQSDCLEDPLKQFQLWHSQAVRSKADDPDAMVLATATLKGKPSARTVLFKGISEGGFLIFTNYRSKKSAELVENPRAAWVFYWPTIYKQVRGEGEVKRLTREESESYFKTRSRESQISAWASEQSQQIPDREYLITRYKVYQQKFSGQVINCPEYWGGFRLIPDRMEFWVGQQHRLHDRFCYLKKNQVWEIVRLSP